MAERAGLTAVILAAGKGVRMRSALPKVLHPVLGRPMVQAVVDTVRSVGATTVALVVGYGRERLTAALAGQDLVFVEQAEQLGTGHAVQCWARTVTPPPTVLIACGDTPLLSAATLREMIERHQRERPALTMMTLLMREPGSYGRVLRDAGGEVRAIREAKDCTPAELAVREINLAVYLCDGPALFAQLPRLRNANRQGEYYLTDVVEGLVTSGQRVIAVQEHDERSTLGINSRLDLVQVAAVMREQIAQRHLLAGVGIDDPATTVIEPRVEIAPDTHLLPGTILAGATRIAGPCVIGPHVELRDAVVGEGARIRFAVVEGVTVPPGATVGPFEHWDGNGRRAVCGAARE